MVSKGCFDLKKNYETFLDVCLSVVFNPHSLGTDEFQKIGNKGSYEARGRLANCQSGQTS